MKAPLKPGQRVAYIRRGFLGYVVEVFRDGDCWCEWDNGLKGCYPRADLRVAKSQKKRDAA